MPDVSAGLEDVIAAASSICDVNGDEGTLSYRGYDIHDLATFATFEEVAYLLWYGNLPNAEQLRGLADGLAADRELPPEIPAILRSFPLYAMPMDVLRTVVSALASFDRNACYYSREANFCKAMRLTAQIPAVVAAYQRIRTGQEVVPPDPNLHQAANFLYTLRGEYPDEVAARAFDIALILHADHELNASTFAARVSAATQADMYSAITAAIGTLAGSLHGGANQRVMEMLEEIGEVENVEPYMKKAFAERKRIMGFGHRVYNTEDPRATHLRRMSRELGERAGNLKWYEMSRQIEEIVKREKGLYPNVDFYSASTYAYLGIPPDLFTPVFACSRIAGWTAHVMEQYANNRLIRPRAEYVGPRHLAFVPLADRK